MLFPAAMCFQEHLTASTLSARVLIRDCWIPSANWMHSSSRLNLPGWHTLDVSSGFMAFARKSRTRPMNSSLNELLFRGDVNSWLVRIFNPNYTRIAPRKPLWGAINNKYSMCIENQERKLLRTSRVANKLFGTRSVQRRERISNEGTLFREAHRRGSYQIVFEAGWRLGKGRLKN